MILLSRYSWLGRYLCVARCCWSVSSWKSPSSAVGGHRESRVGGTLCCTAEAKPCSPAALTLQQVGDEQRRTLVTAGQSRQCQVLLDLQGEEVPARRTGAALSMDTSTGHRARCTCAPVQRMERWRGGHGRSLQTPKEDPAGHTLSSVPLLLIWPLVGFRANIPLCFGGHLFLSGLMFCRSTALVSFLVPACSAFYEM